MPSERLHAPMPPAENLNAPMPDETIYAHRSHETFHTQMPSERLHAPMPPAENLNAPMPDETFHAQMPTETLHAPMHASMPDETVYAPMSGETFHAQMPSERLHAPMPPAENLNAPMPDETIYAHMSHETFHTQMPAERLHAPMSAETLHAPVPAETFLPVPLPTPMSPVTSLPPPAFMDAMQRRAQVSYADSACPQSQTHEPPAQVPTSKAPSTRITTNVKTSDSVNTSGSSRRGTTKKPPGVPSFAELCYSAISHSSTGVLYLYEIYAWVQNNYKNFDPADIKWKNSIRNILKRNPGFKKDNRNARYGNQYSVHPACAVAFLLGQFKITHAEALIAAYNDQNENSCNSQSTQHQPSLAAAHQNYGHQLYPSTQHQLHQHARSHRYQPYMTTQQQHFRNTRHM